MNEIKLRTMPNRCRLFLWSDTMGDKFDLYDRFDPIIMTFPYRKADEGLSVTVINDKVYVNGYEYIHGTWKRTLKALWYRIF